MNYLYVQYVNSKYYYRGIRMETWNANMFLILYFDKRLKSKSIKHKINIILITHEYTTIIYTLHNDVVYYVGKLNYLNLLLLIRNT